MIDDPEIRDLLDIPGYTAFHGVVVTEPDRLFKDAYCDDCDSPAAVYVEYTVLELGEGFIATDATFCMLHAAAGVRCALEHPDRSNDHDTTVSVNYWAIRYGFERAA